MSQQELKNKYNFVFPLRPSKPDNRDYKFGCINNLPDSHKKFGDQVQQKIPDSLDLRDKLTPVRDQGDQNSCFSFATSSLKQYQELINCGFQGDMSPQFFYDNRPDDTDDNGLEDRDVMNMLLNIGICAESDCPYGSILHKKDIPKICYDHALNYRCKSFAAIQTIDDVKLAMVQNGPVLCGLPVYNFGNTFWKPQNDSEQEQGGHANLISAYTQDGFILRNSWGQTWNPTMKGYSFMPYSDFDSFIGLWTAVDDLSSINVYVPGKDQTVQSVVQQNPPQQQTQPLVLLTTAIQDIKWIQDKIIHIVWIKLHNTSTQDVKGVKLTIDSDQAKPLKGLKLTNNKVIFQTADDVVIKPGKEVACILEATGKKPIISLTQ